LAKPFLYICFGYILTFCALLGRFTEDFGERNKQAQFLPDSAAANSRRGRYIALAMKAIMQRVAADRPITRVTASTSASSDENISKDSNFMLGLRAKPVHPSRSWLVGDALVARP
jgi:hypothetical protein